MNICFILTRNATPDSARERRRIPGRQWALDIIAKPDSGPYYPQQAEGTDERRYAFFAGQLAGLHPGPDLPTGHAVATEIATDWTMPEEPDGSWIALKFDRQRDSVSIAADLFLLQRWYYAERDGEWYFSNSLLHLHSVLHGAEICIAAIPYMLLLGYLPLHYTPLNGVLGLRSGEVLSVENGKSTLTTRARVPLAITAHDATAGADEAPQQSAADVLTALRESTAQALRHATEIHLPLSGGIDSRFLLGCALDVLPRERITTVTFGHPRSLDYRIGTGLAKHLGLRNLALLPEQGPLHERLAENFPTAEGMYWTYPDYPVAALRAALPYGTHVLSGYIGDAIFGSYDPAPGLFSGQNVDTEVSHRIIEKIHVCDPSVISELLHPEFWNWRQLTGDLVPMTNQSPAERYLRWILEDCWMNRTNFALQAHRDRAFYITPFIHRQVLQTAFALPHALRKGERGLFAALALGYPDLYGFPTKRNYGFPLTLRPGLRTFAARARRRLLSELDQRVGAWAGITLYQHPKNNYLHPREIHDRKHRDFILAALAELKTVAVFRADALERLRERCRQAKSIHSSLLRGLLTIHQWRVHYGKP